jgi:APA family basic amino acid/polyamine antiporter
MSTPPTGQPALRRQLGLIHAVAVLVGIVLGSGIFVAPAAVAGAAPDRWSACLLWVAGGVVALCGGLVYAECGARIPEAGGFFVFYREAYGPAMAFVAGWAALVVTYPASIAAVAHVFGDALGQAMPALAPHSQALAAAIVLAAGTLSALGVRLGANAQVVLTTAKVGALAALCVAALWGAPATTTAAHVPQPAVTFPAILAAIVVILWTFDGWSDTPLIAGELRQPGRTLGRAILLGIGLLTLLYVAVQAAVLRLLPAGVAAASTRAVSDAVEAGLGTQAGRLTALLIVVSTAGAVNAVIFTASRIAFAMARGGAFPAWFGVLRESNATPSRSVLTVVAGALLYVLLGTFGTLLQIFTFAVWLFYALTAIALLRLRAARVGEPLAWRAPGGMLPPLVILAVSALMTFGVLRDDPKHGLLGLGLLLLGFPAHAAWSRFGTSRAT